MAQLTDDCFAFSGPLLPIPDMERMIAERVWSCYSLTLRISQ